MDKNQKYDDFADVEVERKYKGYQEFAEGPYGSPIRKNERPPKMETREGTRHYTGFNYENKGLHEDLPRQYPGAHPPHDEPDEDVKPPDDNQ